MAQAVCPASGASIGRYVFRGLDCFQASISALNQATEFGPNAMGAGNVPRRISRQSWTRLLPASRAAPAHPRMRALDGSTMLFVFILPRYLSSLRRARRCSEFHKAHLAMSKLGRSTEHYRAVALKIFLYMSIA